MTDANAPAGEKKIEFPPLDSTSLLLRTDDRGRLFAVREGLEDQQVIARSAFPWSKPNAFVSLRSKDGVELLMLESLDGVSAAARELIVHYLDASTFIPKIRRIEKVDLEHGYQLWDVETEAGKLQLRVQEREDIRFLSETRFTVKDANGNVYEIADLNQLDDQSQRELSRVV